MRTMQTAKQQDIYLQVRSVPGDPRSVASFYASVTTSIPVRVRCVMLGSVNSSSGLNLSHVVLLLGC